MNKIDLQGAYFLVPLSPEHYKFLRLFWKGSLYEFLCIAIGFCSAPESLRNSLSRWLPIFVNEASGWSFILMICFSWTSLVSFGGLLSDLKAIWSLLEFLGFIINLKKICYLSQSNPCVSWDDR